MISKNLYEVFTVQPFGGTDIKEAVEESLKISKKKDCIVSLSFNGVPLEIYPSTDIGKVVEEYHKKIRGSKEHP